MRRRTFSSPYYVKGRSHQAEHGGAWRQLEATGVSSSWWLSGNPGSGATLSKDCGRAKRVRNVSRLGAQSGCELRFYAYAIGLKEVGLVRADCVSGHESSKRVQCGEPFPSASIPLLSVSGRQRAAIAADVLGGLPSQITQTAKASRNVPLNRALTR